MGPTDLLVALVGGAAVGLLGKALAPRLARVPDDVPLWLTILCGIAGITAGTLLHGALFDPRPVTVDWWLHLWQGAAAVLLVVAATVASGRPHAHHHHHHPG